MNFALVLLCFVAQAKQGSIDRDVQLLLANDEAVAQAQQQLRAKQITNVDYTKRTQELAKERAAILARYDRNGQRELTARYNAAKRDQAAAAKEAAAKAAADKAAADKAAREAQAKAAADKAEADREAAAAKGREMEEDAGKLVELEYRGQALGLRQGFSSLTAEEQAEQATVLEALQALHQKYAAPPNVSRRFQASAQQRRQAGAPLALSRTLTAFCPEPSRVLADFADDSRRAAALNLLKAMLDISSLPPRGPDLMNRSKAYFAAFNQIDVTYTRQGYDSKAYTDYRDRRKALEADPAFKAEVLHKYFPPGIQKIAEITPEGREAAAAPARAKRGLRFGLTLLATAMAAPFMLWAGKRLRKRAPRPAGEDALDPCALPDDLRTINLLGKAYEVDLDAGRVIDERTWTETTSSIQYSTGSQYTVGNATYYTPGSPYVVTTTTRKDRIFIQTPDGRQYAWMCTDVSFETLKGHVVSRIAPLEGTPGADGYLILCNQTTGQVLELPGVNRLHRMRKLILWLVTAAIAAAGTWWTLAVEMPDLSDPRPDMEPTLAGILAVGGAVWIGVIALFVRWRRNRRFQRVYFPRFQKFLEERTPELVKRCPE